MPNHFVCAKPHATGLAKAVAHKINDIQETLSSLPSGFFSITDNRWHIPREAVFVGYYMGTYVYVTAEQMPSFSDFTLKIFKLATVFQDVQVLNMPSGIRPL